MSYSEQVRHPSDALHPQPERKRGVSLWWYVAAAIAAFILVAVYRPQWLEKIGIHGTANALDGIPNPHGWV